MTPVSPSTTVIRKSGAEWTVDSVPIHLAQQVPPPCG